MAEPYDMGGVPAAPPPPADPTQNKGLIIAALVGVNILCLVAASAASLLLPRPGATAATAASAAAMTEKATAASATPTAEAKATAEPTAAAAAKDETQEAATAAPSASAAAAAPAGGGTRAVVTPPKNGPKAVVRGKPDAKSTLIVILPAGTAVDVTDKTTINKQVWYQVKTVDFTPASTGWMHGTNLKMD